MRSGAFTLLAVLLAAALLGGAWHLWRARGERTVVSVDGRALTARELDARAQTLWNDAKNTEHLVVPREKTEEARAHFRRRAVKMWIMKEIILAEAVARGETADEDDEKAAIEDAERKLKVLRNVTLEQFFAEGPLPPEIKRKDFREGILVDKFLRHEVMNKVRVSGPEVEDRLVELKRRNAALGLKPGETPKIPADRKTALGMLRAEKFNKGVVDLCRALFAKAAVASPEFPEFTKVENVFPEPRRRARGAAKPVAKPVGPLRLDAERTGPYAAPKKRK